MIPMRGLMAATGDPKATVLQLFDQYDLVAISEMHQAKEVHEFLKSLIQTPGLSDRGVTNIVVEFGNARYQSISDRYVMGEQVSLNQLRQIWQNTTQFLVWDSPLYEQFFEAVRESNSRLPHERKIRVILGDPPIGWEIVHTKTDYEQYADRDLFFADIVDREVLSQNQKALIIIGGMHLLNARELEKEVPDKKRSAGDLLHRRHPGKLFVFWHIVDPIPGGGRVGPTALVLRGSSLQTLSFARFAPKGILVQKTISGEKKWVPLVEADWPTTVEMTDGLIYFGPKITRIEPKPAVYHDSLYVKELRRRALILSDVYGMDFIQVLDEALSNKRD